MLKKVRRIALLTTPFFKNKFLFFIIIVSSLCVLSSLVFIFIQTFSAYDDPSRDDVSVQAGLVIYVSPLGNDANSGTSWTDAKKTIASALALAPSNPTDPTHIYIKEGTYQEWLTINAKHKIELYGGFNGTEPPDPDQRSGAETAIDGQKLDRCLTIKDANNIRLDKLTIRNGQAYSWGGGLYINRSDSFVMDNVIVEDSQPYYNTSDGGGMAIISSNSTLTNSIIRRNKSLREGGGAYISGGEVTVNNLTVEDNEAKQGGGMMIQGPAVNLERLWVTDNKATETGGGLTMASASGLSLRRSWFHNNYAAIDGSALEISSGSGGWLVNNLIVDNKGGGPALFVRGSSTNINIEFTVFADNVSTNGVSAIRTADYGSLKADSCGVFYNQSPENRGVMTREFGTYLSLARSFHHGNLPRLWDKEGDSDFSGPSFREGDPRLLNRQYHNIPYSYQLKPESPMMDRYTFYGIPDDFAEKNIRPVKGPTNYDGVDFGPFEYQNPHESTGKHFNNQKLILEGWKGPNNDGDQQKALLHIIVKDEQGHTVIDDMFPQSNDGFYVLSGDYGWDPNKRYTTLIKTDGYLAERLIKTNPQSPDTPTLFRFPAYNSPAVETTLDIAGDANGNNIIDLPDLNTVLINFALNDKTPSGGDFDGDGVVTLSDLNIVLINFALVGESF